MGFNITEKFLDFALLGAEWVMWVLVVLSLISVYVMVERLLYFGGATKADADVRRGLFEALGDGDYGKAAKLTRDTTGPGARIIGEMVAVASRGKAALEAAMSSGRSEEKIRLERNLSFLGTLGANAPFIGLFGTVLGIIQAFNELAKSGVKPGGEQSATVMAGISEALVATAVGLIVAIPAVVAYNIYQRRVKRTLAHAESLATSAFAIILEHQDGGASTSSKSDDAKDDKED
ncbi:MAG: MotA/TolQ/ExbB proton channel family protein [Myxococcota bacterium]